MVGLFYIGVAIIIENDEGKILLGKRSENRFAGGLWEFPAGRLEENEDIESALLREGKEELNLIITPIQLIDAYSFRRKDRDLLLLSYHCSFQGEIVISEEHSELGWFDFDSALEKLSFPLQKETLLKFRKLTL